VIRYFNRSNHSLAVVLNDGTTGFVRSKGVLIVQNVQVSADLHSKVKKGFLVWMGGAPDVEELPPPTPVAKEPEKVSPVGREVASEDARESNRLSTTAVMDFEDVLEGLDLAP
jgi:hypothetical protein